MNFWDSSAILPLLVSEATSRSTRAYLEKQPDVAVWWATPVECMSALARKEREGRLNLSQMVLAKKNLDEVMRNSVVVGASDRVRLLAQKLLRRYPLRAADSLQLAAACVLAGDATGDYGFVCNDERLAIAASKEGFEIIGF
ncbi:type II toxin-antitoxin system VapC family toxin [Coraliomargarita sp. SDUM461003]|uniref:Type II toxin-antitoxin system VapC family toxin n=1 Tax=Thalassobacterium maritimum TaxID=3041265 RepID=A0ABU1AXW6_9BACT|nr:type II toxin-antitoxin system VapC family toxin [Coraliomargarita sp. SDUM461003]MDQ8208991.1 type II toxin-antitoxin system VapC family toxin [Coraliomargarita sp. SDUM461003]